MNININEIKDKINKIILEGGESLNAVDVKFQQIQEEIKKIFIDNFPNISKALQWI